MGEPVPPEIGPARGQQDGRCEDGKGLDRECHAGHAERAGQGADEGRTPTPPRRFRSARFSR